MQDPPAVPVQSMVDPDSRPQNNSSSENDDTLLRKEKEACQILQTSTSNLEIVTVCRFFPFRDPNTPLELLSRRWPARLNTVLSYLGSANYDLDVELNLRKAEEILERTATVSLDPPIWDWEWNPPVASSMEPVDIANNIAAEFFTEFSKVSFLALVKRAVGFRTVPSVTDFLDGVFHAQRVICRRFEELDQSKEPYIAVEKELQNKNPPALWAVSTSVWHTSVSPDPSDALSSIFNPIRTLFEDRALPLIPMLQRLEILAILHQNILDGMDSQWNGLLVADFSFLEYINDHEPQEVGRLLTMDDFSYWQKVFPVVSSWHRDRPLPRSLQVICVKWTTLVVIVTKLCANAPHRIGSIIETTKVLLDGRNFFSGMALLEGLHKAHQHPPELFNYWKLLDPHCNFAHYRLCWSSGYGIPYFFPHLTYLLTPGSERRTAAVLYDLLRCMAYTGLPQRIGDNPGDTGLLQRIRDNPGESGSNSTKAETRCGRTCTGAFSEFTSTLLSNIYAGMQQHWASHFKFSGGTERDLEKGVSPLSQAVEFHLKSEEEMHEKPPLIKERESDQDMNSIRKRLPNGAVFKSRLTQKMEEKIERKKSYVDRSIRVRTKAMWCCCCQRKVSFALGVCCICRHRSRKCGECSKSRSAGLETKEQGVEDEKIDNDSSTLDPVQC